MATILIAGATDLGKSRTDNQDTFICQQLWSDDTVLLGVIDGVGGYAGGEVAAAIARDSITRYMASPKGDTLTMLREAVVFANNNIAQQSIGDDKLFEMCCVLTAAVADAKSQQLHFVHVGDTRLYRLRGRSFEKLTKDHSLVGIREDAGDLTETEAMQHPRRNEIMREVGYKPHRIDDPDFLEYDTGDFRPGDLLLFCSDGLTDMLTRSEILQVLGEDSSLEAKLGALIRKANDAGGKDNITVVLAQNVSKFTQVPEKPAGKNPSVKVEAASIPQEVISSPATPAAPVSPWRKKGLPIFLAALVAVTLLSIWYTQNDKSLVRPQMPEQANNTVTASIPDSNSLQQALLRAEKQKDRKWVLTPGNLPRFDGETLMLQDSLHITGNGGIIMPTDSLHQQPLFHIAGNSNIVIENLTIKNFAVAFVAEQNVKLQLKNVQFVNVPVPVKAALKNDSVLNLQFNILTDSIHRH